VDDASTDGSYELLLEMQAAHPRIELLRMETTRNASACRNRGLQMARGEYVIFLDSDDILAPQCCAQRTAAAREYPDYDLWVFPMHLFRESATTPHGAAIPRAGDHGRRFLAHQLDWQTMQPLWRKAFLERLEGFDESFARLQDPEIHARAMLAGARVKCFPEASPDCSYRTSDDRHIGNVANLSASHVRAAKHFYRTFLPRVSGADRTALTGTLFGCLAQHVQWWRGGRLSAQDLREVAGELAEACEVPWHRGVLRGYAAVQLLVPVHLPGLNWATRTLLNA
jgi:GT2 family glycosyltransferase